MKLVAVVLFAIVAVSFAEECKDIWDDMARENETYCEHYNLPFLNYCKVGKFGAVMMTYCKKTCGYCTVEAAHGEDGAGATEAAVVVAEAGVPAEEAATVEVVAAVEEAATVAEVVEAVKEAVEEVVDGLME